MRTRPSLAAFLVGLFLMGAIPDSVVSQDSKTSEWVKEEKNGRLVGAFEQREIQIRANVVSPIFDPPMSVPVGGLCMVDVPNTDLEKFDFVIIGGSYDWDGTKIVFTPKKPLARVLLDARSKSPLLLVPTQEENRGIFHIVMVGGDALRIVQLTIGTGPAPGPHPPPGPGPTPTPTIPDGVLGFTKLSYTEAVKINDRANAKALADNFDGTAAAIAAGAIRTVEAANAELKGKNQTTLDVSIRPRWTPFFVSWAAAADAAVKAGTLKVTPEAYSEVYRATADGLRRASQ